MKNIKTLIKIVISVCFTWGILHGAYIWSNVYPAFSLIHGRGKTIAQRIKTPPGYRRVHTAQVSFANYLRNMPLKPVHAKVHYYNGTIKPNHGIYCAVIDMDTGKRDLQQCADAIMRLRAEYLFARKNYQDIHFNFTNGFRADYTRWMQGHRIRVKGNHVYWEKATAPGNSYAIFKSYMNLVFAYAGTLSLEKELIPAGIHAMRIGDIFIQGGSPGHAVIVVDMARHTTSGEIIFLLAQSYMPAQDIHVLQNPSSKKLTPWYSTQFGNRLATPEWNFSKNNLKRFPGNK
jgi:hypothetical protein